MIISGKKSSSAAQILGTIEFLKYQMGNKVFEYIYSRHPVYLREKTFLEYS